MESFARTKFAAIAASLAVAATTTMTMSGANASPVLSSSTAARASHHAGLPVATIEKSLEADGHLSHGVLEVDINRSDVSATGGQDHSPFATGFQLQHEIYFQSLGRGRAIVNGDLSLKASEIQPAIDSLLAHGLQVQAEHQHLYDMSPMMWYLHFRGVGKPAALAKKVEAAIHTTSTPQPQSDPAHPTTALPSKRLAHVLGGEATIGENGVVTIGVDRSDQIRLGGIRIKPELNVSTNVQFEPAPGGGAVVVADLSMKSAEVNPVLKTMRHRGWESGCLYNQETAEQPQLYFDHFYKTGDPVKLAKQVRRALDKTDAQS